MATPSKKWNSLTDQQKRSFGDRIVINASNLQAWAKPYAELSDHKRKMVDHYIMTTEVEHLDNFVG